MAFGTLYLPDRSPPRRFSPSDGAYTWFVHSTSVNPGAYAQEAQLKLLAERHRGVLSAKEAQLKLRLTEASCPRRSPYS